MSLVTETLSFGVQEGNAFNDIVAIGGFPGEQKIKGIRKIRLMAGWLVDSIEITYQLTNGQTAVANHLGSATPDATIDFNENEVLIGVTGKRGIPGYYSNKPYLAYVKFAIADTATGNIRVAGPYGNGAGDAKYTGPVFTVTGPIIAFSGKLLTEGSDPKNALTLSFIKAISVNESGNLTPL